MPAPPHAARLDCPECGAPLTGLARSCAGCGARYRSAAMAALLSVGLPGAGHIFLGRRLLGSIELLGGLGLLGVALYRLMQGFLSAMAGEASPLSLLRICVPWALALAGYSLASGLFTWLVSRRRLVPEGPARKEP